MVRRQRSRSKIDGRCPNTATAWRSGTRSPPPDALLGGGDRMLGDLTGLFQFRTQAEILRLEMHHAPDPLEVHALTGQFGDAPEHRDVVIAVAPVAAVGAGRIDEPAPFVDPQCLRMHPGEFRGDRDDVHRAGGRALGRSILVGHVSALRGFTVVAAASCSIAARWSSDSSDGTATSTVTIRSPVAFAVAIPRALHPMAAAALRSGSQAEGDGGTLEGRHVDLAAEGGLGERDRDPHGEIVAAATEPIVRCHLQLDEQVTVRARRCDPAHPCPSGGSSGRP